MEISIKREENPIPPIYIQTTFCGVCDRSITIYTPVLFNDGDAICDECDNQKDIKEPMIN